MTALKFITAFMATLLMAFWLWLTFGAHVEGRPELFWLFAGHSAFWSFTTFMEWKAVCE